MELTKKDVLLQHYPNVRMIENVPQICPYDIAGAANIPELERTEEYADDFCPYFAVNCAQCMREYWNKPYAVERSTN